MEKNKPGIIITVIDADGETVIWPEWFEKKYYLPANSWTDYQGWLAEILSEYYDEVYSYYDEQEEATITVYKLKK